MRVDGSGFFLKHKGTKKVRGCNKKGKSSYMGMLRVTLSEVFADVKAKGSLDDSVIYCPELSLIQCLGSSETYPN